MGHLSALIRKFDMWLKEHIISVMNNITITMEIVKEFKVIETTSEIISEQVLALAKSVEAQRDIKGCRYFDLVKYINCNSSKHSNKQHI